MAVQKQQPIRIFYSYSHKDERFLDKLQTHLALLKREALIEEWSDRKITAGREWEGAIDENLEAAHIILLLVSNYFIASDYCYDKEMRRAIEKHEERTACVIPIILRPSDWQTAPFGKLQALPKDAKPVNKWRNQDDAWVDIAKGIRKAIQSLALKQPNPRSQGITEDRENLADTGSLERGQFSPGTTEFSQSLTGEKSPHTSQKKQGGLQGEVVVLKEEVLKDITNTAPTPKTYVNLRIKTIQYNGHKIALSLDDTQQFHEVFHDGKLVSSKHIPSGNQPVDHSFTVQEDGAVAQYQVVANHNAFNKWKTTILRNGGIIFSDE